MLASEEGDLASVKKLLHLGCDKNRRKGEGEQTAVMLAASNGHLEVLILLVEKERAEFLMPDNNGMTPLMHASHHGHTAHKRAPP
jgi:ankyrin repeat protein